MIGYVNSRAEETSLPLGIPNKSPAAPGEGWCGSHPYVWAVHVDVLPKRTVGMRKEREPPVEEPDRHLDQATRGSTTVVHVWPPSYHVLTRILLCSCGEREGYLRSPPLLRGTPVLLDQGPTLEPPNLSYTQSPLTRRGRVPRHPRGRLKLQVVLILEILCVFPIDTDLWQSRCVNQAQ